MKYIWRSSLNPSEVVVEARLKAEFEDRLKGKLVDWPPFRDPAYVLDLNCAQTVSDKTCGVYRLDTSNVRNAPCHQPRGKRPSHPLRGRTRRNPSSVRGKKRKGQKGSSPFCSLAILLYHRADQDDACVDFVRICCP